MTDNAWEVIGRLAKGRRERLGLRQEELRQYGGPGVSTVGKIERAAQANFPLRTQQQLEKALGWPRGTIEEVIQSVDVDKDWDAIGPDWEADLLEHNLPDLTDHDQDEGRARPVARASALTDAELLAELTYRVRQYAEVMSRPAVSPAALVQAELGRRGKNPGWLMDASGLAVDELMPFLSGAGALSEAQARKVEAALDWSPGALVAGPEQAAPAGGQATGGQQARRDRTG